MKYIVLTADGRDVEGCEGIIFPSLKVARWRIERLNERRGLDGDPLILDDGSRIVPILSDSIANT